MHYKLTKLKAVALLVIVGLATYSSGLSGPFMGDDIPQIVDNPTVHSLSHIATFFKGSTFYSGNASQPLGTGSYRPLMTTVFSLLYSMFGERPVAFHAVQLALHISCAALIFVIFSYFLKRPLSLLLALIFLVHPANSTAVFSISALQEPLFTLFGLLAFWLVIRTQERSLWHQLTIAGCLFLSLLAKETGALFVAVCLLYLLLAARKRFWALLAAMTAMACLYGLLRMNAVGIPSYSAMAPIDNLTLGARLLNIPSIVSLYAVRVLMPINLAQAYYWAYDTVTYKHFVLPLATDAAVVGALVYVGWRLSKAGRKIRRYLNQYVFFSAWATLGLLLVMQIYPLDMTASETWLYFPIIGLLGMAGAAYEALAVRPQWRRLGLIAAVLCISLFGVRTFIRGFDWHDQTTLSYRNISVSKEDYVSYNLISNHFVRLGQFKTAQTYVDASIALYPTYINQNTLGAVQVGLGDYQAAKTAFYKAIDYGGDTTLVYDNLALLMATDDPQGSGPQFYQRALAKFPQDGVIWFYFAMYANNRGAHDVAVMAIQQAQRWGYFEQAAYDSVLRNKPYPIQINTSAQ